MYLSNLLLPDSFLYIKPTARGIPLSKPVKTTLKKASGILI